MKYFVRQVLVSIILVCTFSVLFWPNKVLAWTETDQPIYVDSIGDRSAEGLLNMGRQVTLDSSGNVYVVEGTNHRVQKFDANGNYLRSFGSYGTGDGQLNAPSGVGIDSAGNVIVVDYGNGRLVKFDQYGNYLSTFASYGTGDGQLKWPMGVSIDTGDNIYVADYGNSRIQKFSSAGAFMMKFGSAGSGDGQLNYPSGVTVDSSGNIFVADTSNNRIQKFNSAGVFSLKFGSVGTGDGQFTSPYEVALDSTGNIYVVDYNERVSKFDATGTFISKFGSSGTGNGSFTRARSLVITDDDQFVYVSEFIGSRVQKFTVDGTYQLKFGGINSSYSFYRLYSVRTNPTNGDFVVSDTGNSVVKVFSSSWEYKYTIGSPGTGDGQFATPWGPYFMAFDNEGNVYVADSSNNRIQKFDSSGNFILKFGSAGTGDGQFSYPLGVAIDSSSNVYVADVNNHRIQKFTSGGVFISKFGTLGTGDGQFNKPSVLHYTLEGNLLVTETGNKRVQKVTTSGVYISKFGSSGTGDGQFTWPSGISTDSSGNIFVADTSNNRIQKFDPNGTFLAKFGTLGIEHGKFQTSTDVVTYSQNVLYVVDSANNRIEKFMFDRISPTHAITAVPGDATSETNLRITSNISDALSAVTAASYQVDSTDGSWSACDSADSSFNELTEEAHCELTGLTEGEHTVYIKAADSYTNVNGTGEYGVYTFTVDTTDPTGTVEINAGATLANTREVTLTLSSADSTHVKHSNSADFSGASWEAYTASKAHTLTTGEGTKTVYVKYKDGAGNESETYSDTITLDTTKPITKITDLGLITDVPDKTPLFYYFTSQTPRIKGTTEALSTVHFEYGDEDYTTTAAADGKYEITLPELPREQVELTYYAVDPAENQGSNKILKLMIGVENFPAELVSVIESDTDETPIPTDGTATPTPSTTSVMTVYGIQVVDAEGKTLANTTIYINGQEYRTDENGKVYLEAKPTEEMEYEVEINGKRVKGTVLGDQIKAEAVQTSSKEDGSKSYAWIWWAVGAGAMGIIGLRFFKK